MSTSTNLVTSVGAFSAEAFALALESHKGLPSWWLERKEAAYKQFTSLAYPSATDESWRFSTRSGFKLDGFLATNSPATTAAKDIGLPGKPALTFVNNSLTGSNPVDQALTQKGLVVSTLKQALKTHSEVLKAHFMAQDQRLGSAKFAALHTAFINDGAFIYVPKGMELKTPITIVHSASGANTAVFPHTLVITEENAQVSVIDYFVSDSTSAHFCCGANDLYAGHGSKLNYVGLQNWSTLDLCLQMNSTVVKRDARAQSLNLHLGGHQARHESLSQLQAPGAFSEMLALTIASGEREFDQRTLQIHQAPNTKSDLLYKNVLQDKARTIFSGLIVVDQDAQKTDAYQSNRNLMLSDSAEANSLPGLEIQANDVRCTHGATTSRVDPEELFYLQARCIPEAKAHELLVFGFFEEVLNRLEDDELHAALRTIIQSNFN
ncbi:MAG: Fe-S cluster assembly protein SufD [Verrucomicrobiota bacterium]|jgi:Fe-S cluster assembly protein SufD|nr:MAG: Fe-S cluster assembly protein SufD [Verrucomicrobiota bacterium]